MLLVMITGILFQNGCGCWGGDYTEATQYLFGGIIAFSLNLSNNIWSIAN